MVLLEHSEPVQCCHSPVGLHLCGMESIYQVLLAHLPCSLPC